MLSNPASVFIDASSHLHGVLQDVSSAVELYSKKSMEALTTATKDAKETEKVSDNSASEAETKEESPSTRTLSPGSTETSSAWMPVWFTNESEPWDKDSRAREIKKMYQELRKLRENAGESKKYQPEKPESWTPKPKAEEFEYLVAKAKKAGAVAAKKTRAEQLRKGVDDPALKREAHPREFAAQLVRVKRGEGKCLFFRGEMVRGQMCDVY